MAGNVLRLGRRAHSDRSSAQHVFSAEDGAAGPVVKSHIPMDPTMILLSFAFAAAWTVTSAMAAHLPRNVEAVRRDAGASGVSRHDDRPGAGCGTRSRGQHAQPVSPAVLDAARCITIR